jgi:site-specific DNA-methyltransferase (adenine-specific)
MYSFSGETVLDPFLGSGTTTLAAREEGRDSIGVELDESNRSIIGEKLAVEHHLFGRIEEGHNQEIYTDDESKIMFKFSG